MSIDKIHTNINPNNNIKERILDPYFAIQKKDGNHLQDLQGSKNYFINEHGKRVYHTKEDERAERLKAPCPHHTSVMR